MEECRDGQSRSRLFSAVAQCGLDLGMKGKETFCSAKASILSLYPLVSLALNPFLSSGQAAAQVGKGHQKDQGEEEGIPGERTRRQ